MRRACAHSRLAGIAVFAVLAFVAALVGRSLTLRLDLGKHVPAPSYASAQYYVVLLAFVKVSVAVILVAVAWRFVRARASARAARRVLAAVGARPLDAPRVRVELSLRRWVFAFGATSAVYLVQTDVEQLAVGNSTIVSPWLHTSALPVFAILAIGVALVHDLITRWLTAYEAYAARVAVVARSLVAALKTPRVRHQSLAFEPPRRLFGLAFESRPPPARA